MDDDKTMPAVLLSAAKLQVQPVPIERPEPKQLLSSAALDSPAPVAAPERSAAHCTLCGDRAVVIGIASHSVGTLVRKACPSCDYRWFDRANAIF
jgi:hypothetical protein